MKKIFMISAVFVALFASNNSEAFQYCSCSDKYFTVAEKLDMSYAVFTGKVKQIDIQRDKIKVTFDVFSSWKGVKFTEASVYTDRTDQISTLKNGVSCGYKFERHGQYLLFTDRNKNQQGPSWVSACGDVQPLNESSSDMQYLEGLEKIELKNR